MLFGPSGVSVTTEYFEFQFKKIIYSRLRILCRHRMLRSTQNEKALEGRLHYVRLGFREDANIIFIPLGKSLLVNKLF